MNDMVLSEQLDAAVTRLLSGEATDAVLAAANPSVRPYAAAFSAILHAPARPRPGYIEKLHADLLAKYARSQRRAGWAIGARRAAAAAAAAALVGGAINPSLAASLQKNVREAFGEPISQVFDRLIPEAISPGSATAGEPPTMPS